MRKPKNRNENIVVQELENEILIYDLKTNKAFCLNETSAMIWQMCDGTKSVAQISHILTQRLNQLMTEEVIWLALNDFKKDNLLEENECFEIDFNGLTRRQVIKKIGFASMVVLPAISSIIAPGAVDAASSNSCTKACSSPASCSSPCSTCQGTGYCGGRLPFLCNNPGGACTIVDSCVPDVFSSSGHCFYGSAPCSSNADCSRTDICQGSGNCQQ